MRKIHVEKVKAFTPLLSDFFSYIIYNFYQHKKTSNMKSGRKITGEEEEKGQERKRKKERTGKEKKKDRKGKEKGKERKRKRKTKRELVANLNSMRFYCSIMNRYPP